MNTILHRFSVAGMALVTALSAGNAFAYGAGDVFTHFGIAKVSPTSDNGHFGGLDMDVDVDDDTGFAFTLGYRFLDKWGVELLAAEPFEHDINLNGNELAAAVGRVQLRRLPQIIGARRRVAGAIADGLAGATAVRLGRELPETEGVYWFVRVHVDTQRLTVNKDTFAHAVAAEGIPTNPSYRHLPAEADWFRRRRVFPPSDYPWGLPAYDGDREATFPCPQAIEAVESHFLLHIHENFSGRDTADIVAALRKVEAAYLKEERA